MKSLSGGYHCLLTAGEFLVALVFLRDVCMHVSVGSQVSSHQPKRAC